MMVIVTQYERWRREACEWLQAHGVDPGVYPNNAKLRPDGDGNSPPAWIVEQSA